MTTKHTPGPWKYTVNVGPTKGLLLEADGSTIMEMVNTHGSRRFEKDLQFIAAAPETAAERDRLRAALEMADDFDTLGSGVFRHKYRVPFGTELAAVAKARKEALANTSPAPVESVNKELLDALDEAYGELSADSTRDGPRCLLLTQIEAVIAKAEKAGG